MNDNKMQLMGKKVVRLEGGDEVELEQRKRHELVCCDCGSVHDFVFVVHGHGTFFAIRLNLSKNESKTAKERREIKKLAMANKRLCPECKGTGVRKEK